MALALLPVFLSASEPVAPPASGRTRELAAVRTATAPQIDGSLDDVVWSDASVATDFWISEYRQAPAERTEVRVLVDDEALYFAVTCYDSRPEKIRADQGRRDSSMSLDDQFTLELDPYHNHRLISRFSVNARGTQSDVMAGGRSRNIAWKGEWHAAALRTDSGWTVEMAIPFDILEFNPAADVFGVNFVRYHARTQESSRWADVTPQNLAEEAGHLVMLQLPKGRQQTRLMMMPYASGGVNTVDRAGIMRDTTGSTGVDLRLDTANSLSGVLTVRPDFSHVEDAVLDVGFDRNEKYRPDARPFFQEGANFFGSRTYFYSSRIPDFLAGAKAFGKVGASQLGVIALGNETDGRRDYVASFKHELGATVNAGATFVGTDRPEFSNRLFAVQSNGRVGRKLRFNIDLARTSTVGVPGDGTRAALSLGYGGPHLQFTAMVDRTDPLFFPANGFLAADSLGTKAASAHLSYGRGFGKGWLRRADTSVSFGERQTLDGSLQRQDMSIYGGLVTRANMQINAGMSRGPYRPRSGVDAWQDAIYDDRFYTASFSQYTPNARFGYGVTYSQGVFSDSDYRDVAPSLWLKPTAQSAVSYSYERADYYEIFQQHILSFSWDITTQQGITGRWVQYGEPYYRLTYRRVVRRGFDLFAVYNRDPHRRDQFVTKIVWSMNLLSRREPKAPLPSPQSSP